MRFLKWLNLQMFAGEGAGDGAAGDGAGAATGVEASDPGKQRLMELGVPESKIRKNRSYRAPAVPAAAEPEKAQEPEVQDDAAKPTEGNHRMSWEEITKDPEYQKELQNTIRARLKNSKAAEEKLAKLSPSLEILAKRYGQNPDSIDYDALGKAIGDDASMYETEALEMGVSVEKAKQILMQERENKRLKAQMEQRHQEDSVMQHFQGLRQQAEELKKTFPSFDLQKELQNEQFFKWTSPEVGMRVEDAYYALHRNEIQAAAMQVAVEKSKQKFSNAVQSGTRRPVEAGISGQAPSVSSFNMKSATRQQREELRRRIRAGEKIIPGHEFD